MRVSKEDARPWDALRLTFALWVLVIVIYMPILLRKHAGEPWTGLALDAGTMFVSMGFGMALFCVYRATVESLMPVRALALGTALLAIVLFQSGFDFLFTGFIAQNVQHAWQTLPRDLTHNYMGAFNYLCVFGANLGLFHLAYQHRRGLRQSVRLADAQTMAQQAQLTALRFQLNPHFLFNTLNAISSMIVTHRNAEAEMMTDRLSSFLRASLSFDPTAMVPLEEEFALIEEYLEIENVRFEDRLTTEIVFTPEAAAVPVPSFLLQPLAENAIKYGVSPSPEPVHVRLSGRCEEGELVIMVEDDGGYAHETSDRASTGVGLANVRRRLEAVYGRRSSLEAVNRQRGFAAVIRLPVTAPITPPQTAR